MPDDSEDVPMSAPLEPALNTPSPTHSSQQRCQVGPIQRNLGPEPHQAESSRVQGKRKHPDEGPGLRPDTSSSESPNAKKARTVPPSAGEQAQPRTRAGMKAKKPPREKRPNEWQVPKGEVKKEERGTKDALQLHIRALWCLPNQNAIPPAITDNDRAVHASRFVNEVQIKTSVRDSLNRNSTFIHAAEARLDALYTSLSDNSIISCQIARISRPQLLFAFRTVACAGLPCWAPDVQSLDPDSMYNLLHEYLAVNTFQQVAISHGYDFMGINRKLINDFPTLHKFYRSFIYSYITRLAKKEAKSPGSVGKSHEQENIVKRRSDLSANRIDILKAEAFNMSFINSVAEPDGHSDDEGVEITNADGIVESVYHITKKEGRSQKYTNFFQKIVDQRRLRKSRKRGNRHQKQERKRVVPDPAKRSPFFGEPLPELVFIDWFEPSFWNNELIIEDRAHYIKNGVFIGMPEQKFCEKWEDIEKWKNMKPGSLKAKYEAELRQLEKNQRDSEEDDDNEGGDEGPQEQEEQEQEQDDQNEQEQEEQEQVETGLTLTQQGDEPMEQ